ncbi:hypothetical protein, partial [Klebsiella pneumoniae]|uniref:hypothetical protein n=1 Tax=Klebsiella pneumoniae TaxID=573 RepID=UPI0035BB50B9
RAYCLKTQPATGETYPKSDLFNKAQLVILFFLAVRFTFCKKEIALHFFSIIHERLTNIHSI